MIYRVMIKRDGYHDIILCKADSVIAAMGKVQAEYPEHTIESVTQDQAIAILE